jgi:protein-S-isoprenylcysteine O-methyltransferase Ste14
MLSAMSAPVPTRATALARTLLFTVLVPGTVAGLLPWRLALRSGAEAAAWASPRGALAAVVGAVGLAFYARCALDFALEGRGTPAPIDAPRFLVRGHLYRRSRNPMYLGVLGMIAAWALAFGAWWIALYGVVILVLFQSFVILYEEPTLRRSFGAEYERYCERVPRWWRWRRPPAGRSPGRPIPRG